MQRYGNDLRFLKRRNLKNTADVYRNMISDYIHSHGVSFVYYRRNFSFFEKDKTKITADPIYGADPTAPYTVKANIVAFMEVMSDSYLLNRFGIQSEAEVQAYIGIRDFVERFKPLIGKEVQKTYNIPVCGNVSCGIVSGILNTPEIYGKVTGKLPTSGITESSYTLTGMIFVPLQRPKDLLFKKSLEYDLADCTSSLFSATLEVDAKGNISGIATGSITHKMNYADNQSSEYEIRPQVGDLLVLDNEEGMIQDKFEITRVDRRAQGQSLIYNPLLDAYCYIVTCVQHRDSYEDVDIQQEIKDDPESIFNAPGMLNSKNELDSDNSGISKQADDIQDFANDQYDYSEDGNNKDYDAYGGYQKRKNN